MVVALKPGRFYGRALPRPRFYDDTKLNDHRVSPPVPVNQPFLSWANNAHWSMGGLSIKRVRMQGKIEGKVSKLRSEKDSGSLKKKLQSPSSATRRKRLSKPRVEKGKDVAVEGEAEGEANPPRGKRIRRKLVLDDEELSEAELEEDFEKNKDVPPRRSSRIQNRPEDAGPSKRRHDESSDSDADESKSDDVEGDGECVPETPVKKSSTPLVANRGSSLREDNSPRPRRSPRLSSKSPS